MSNFEDELLRLAQANVEAAKALKAERDGLFAQVASQKVRIAELESQLAYAISKRADEIEADRAMTRALCQVECEKQLEAERKARDLMTKDALDWQQRAETAERKLAEVEAATIGAIGKVTEWREAAIINPAIVEAIVRDCAAYCSIGCTKDQYASTEIRKQIGDMILARYGLEGE